MTTVTNDMSLHEAAKAYQDIGFYIHPLRPRDKIPIMNKWSEIDTHFTESELKSHFDIKDPKNIGLICGKVSDCTVIDRDFIVKGIWEGLDSSLWVRQQRTDNRDHLLFRYCPDLQAKKYHALGFEILNNGNNCVLTPSIHPSGDVYQFTEGDPEDRPQMSKELIDRIKKTITAFEALQRSVNNCRHVFRKFFKAYFTDNQRSNPHYRDMSVFHGASGRELTLYLFAELKANGATFEQMDLLCKLIFLDEYDSADSEYQIGKIAPKATAKKETIQAHPILSQFYDASEDVTTAIRGQASKLGKPDPQTTEEEPVKEEAPEYIKARAKEIAETGDPVSYILHTCDGLHVGDDGVKKTLLVSIGIQSVLNSDGIQPKVSGDSGKGKTHCCKAMAHLIPRGWIHETALSDKAIYYMDPKEGSIIFCDDIDLSETLEGVIKRATSNFQEGTSYTTLDIKRKKETKRIPARLSWWLTSVDDDQSLQLLNRQFGGGVDESPEQDRRVMQFQLERAASGEVGLPETDEVLTCREILRDIKLSKYVVKIPFAKNIIWNDPGNRRNLPIFLDIIKSFAVLRHRQRQKDSDGCLIADLEDYEDAKALYTSRAENQGLKLTDAEMRFCVVLANRKEATREEIAKALGVTVGRVSHLVYGKNKNSDSGLINKVKGLSYEKRTVETAPGHYAQKVYFRLSDFNAFDLFESVVSLAVDDTHDYHTDTYTDTYNNNNSRQCDTSDTHNKEENEESENSLSNDESSTFTQETKKGVSEVSDLQPISNSGVSVGVISGVTAATDSGNYDSVLLKNVFSRLKSWEKTHGPINHTNSWMAVQDIGKALKLSHEEIKTIVEKYAKLADPEMCRTPAEVTP